MRTIALGHLKDVSSRTRSRHLFVLDVVALTAAGALALALWLDASTDPMPGGPFFWVVGIIVASRIAANITLGLYAHSWRYASTNDMLRIIACCLAGTVAGSIIVVGAATFQPPGIMGIPALAFFLMEAALALVVLALPRFIIRMVWDLPLVGDQTDVQDAPRTLLYGAGWAGVTFVRSVKRQRDRSIIPVGFIDDDPDLSGRRVAGLPVFGGLDSLRQAARQTKASCLLITMPNATGEAVRKGFEAASEHGLDVRTVPPVTDLLDGTLDASRIRRVRVEDLLRRPVATEHAEAVRSVFEDSTVVITGGAGSIGSEMARQVLALEPARIVLVDQAESPLYLIQRDLEERRAAQKARGFGGETQIVTHLADVAERQTMDAIFARWKPDVVLHAAAYKHVPLLEDHPVNALRTNVGGTLSVLEAAGAAGVERFVLVSTDKAVWPSNIMGASKRVAEMLVADAARRYGRPYISVRFGNVLGSNGSVVPIFQSQLERGQPLTITHPEMTRYFMTIPEASWLILDAAAIAETGGLFVLDMGESVKVLDIARDLVRLAGRDPDSVPIEVIGLRKGEKLHEELFYDEESVVPTAIPKVLRAESASPHASIRAEVADMLADADGSSDARLRERLHRIVRETGSSYDREADGRRPQGDPADLESQPVVRDRIAIRVHTDAQPAPTPASRAEYEESARPGGRTVEVGESR